MLSIEIILSIEESKSKNIKYQIEGEYGSKSANAKRWVKKVKKMTMNWIANFACSVPNALAPSATKVGWYISIQKCLHHPHNTGHDVSFVVLVFQSVQHKVIRKTSGRIINCIKFEPFFDWLIFHLYSHLRSTFEQFCHVIKIKTYFLAKIIGTI